MNILITGYYGAGNFGDDIMLESICKKILNRNKDVKISILKLFERDIQVELPKEVKIINFHKVKGIFRDTFMKYLFMKHDMLLWGGGTCFTDSDGDGYHYYMKMAKEKGLKIGYLGVGVGKLTKEDRISKTKYLMENLDFISLRDVNSYNYCMENVKNPVDKVFLAEDLAYLYFENKELRKEKVKSKKVNVILSWRDLGGYYTNEKENELLDEVIDFCNIILKGDNVNIFILPLDDRKDIAKCSYINEKLNNKDKVTLVLNKTPKEKVEILNSCDINISGRLHGMFVTEILGIKTIGLNYSVKMDEFLKSIGKEEDGIQVNDIKVNKLLEKYKTKNNEVSVETIENKIMLSNNNIDRFIDFIGNTY